MSGAQGFTAVSPRWWTARQVLLGAVAGPVTVATVVAALLTVGAAAAAGAAAGLLALTAAAWVVLRRRYLAWGYLERDEDLLVRRGVLVRRLTVVPYGRMQLVDVSAGPVDRAFGLATVELHTAAARTDARIPGLAYAEAERLRDRLATVGEASAMGL